MQIHLIMLSESSKWFILLVWAKPARLVSIGSYIDCTENKTGMLTLKEDTSACGKSEMKPTVSLASAWRPDGR